MIRHRLAQLPTPTRTCCGRQPCSAGTSTRRCWVRWPVTRPPRWTPSTAPWQAGFLTEREPDGRLRFTHILVRDTLYADLSTPRRAAWHAAVARGAATTGARRAGRARAPPAPRRRHRPPRRAAAYARGGGRAGRTGRQPARGGPPVGQAIDAYDRAGAGRAARAGDGAARPGAGAGRDGPAGRGAATACRGDHRRRVHRRPPADPGGAGRLRRARQSGRATTTTCSPGTSSALPNTP